MIETELDDYLLLFMLLSSLIISRPAFSFSSKRLLEFGEVGHTGGASLPRGKLLLLIIFLGLIGAFELGD